MDKTLLTEKGLRLAIMLAMMVIILAGVKAASQILVLFLLATFLALILYPLVSLLAKLRVPRSLSAILLVGGIICLMIILMTRLGLSLNEFARSIPQYRSLITNKLDELQYIASRFNINISIDELMSFFDPGAIVNLVTSLLSYLSHVTTTIFIISLMVVFMLLEVRLIPVKLQRITNKPLAEMKSIKRALSSVTRYLIIKTIISAVTGLIVWFFLTQMGVRFAFLWGMMAFMFNYIPNIGSILAALPPIIQTLLFSGFSDATILLMGYLSLNIIMGNMIEPKVMGRGLGLSILVVFLSLIFWGWLLGPVGMLLAVPLTAITKIALETTPEGNKFAIVLGDGSEKN